MVNEMNEIIELLKQHNIVVIGKNGKMYAKNDEYVIYLYSTDEEKYIEGVEEIVHCGGDDYLAKFDDKPSILITEDNMMISREIFDITDYFTKLPLPTV